tara:strand:+ start:543 stop:1004 length:462 start_codon:yes stop_codon:yes gene_type:complete
MTDQINTPSSLGESKENAIFYILALAVSKELVDSDQSDIKHFLVTKGEMVFGLIKINKFLEGRNKNHDLALETITACRKEIEKLRKEKNKCDEELVLHKASIVNLNERVLFMEKEFSTLCNKRNEDFHTLKLIQEKQRKFIKEANEKLKRLGT